MPYSGTCAGTISYCLGGFVALQLFLFLGFVAFIFVKRMADG